MAQHKFLISTDVRHPCVCNLVGFWCSLAFRDDMARKLFSSALKGDEQHSTMLGARDWKWHEGWIQWCFKRQWITIISARIFFAFVIENFRHWHLSAERETFSSRNQMKLTWSDVLWKLIWTFDGENCLTKKFKDFLSGFVCFSDDFVYREKTTTRVVQCLM